MGQIDVDFMAPGALAQLAVCVEFLTRAVLLLFRLDPLRLPDPYSPLQNFKDVEMPLYPVACANCGEELWVSGEQEKLSCLYCEVPLAISRNGGQVTCIIASTPVTAQSIARQQPGQSVERAITASSGSPQPWAGVMGASNRFPSWLAAIGVILVGTGLLLPAARGDIIFTPPPKAVIVEVTATPSRVPVGRSAVPTDAAAAAWPPTRTPTATAAPKPMLKVGQGACNLRAGPGTNYSIVSTTQPGEEFVITGSDALPANWWRIILRDGREAWISADLGEARDAAAVRPVNQPTSVASPTVVKPSPSPNVPVPPSTGS